jgi:hypothetical protein
MFVVWMNHPRDVARCGYLRRDGSATPWMSHAARFESIDCARVEIMRRGAIESSRVIPGRVTAYVAHELGNN